MAPMGRAEGGFKGLAAALLIILLAAAFFPVVFGGRTLQTSSWCPGTTPSGPYGAGAPPSALPVIDPGASSWQNEPWSAKIREEFKAGRWPLWNPESGVGTPLLANAQSAPFSPLRAIPHLFGSPAAWDAYYLLRLLLAGFFTFLFLRLWKLSLPASLAGAVVFMFTGYNILYINMGHLDVDILIPAFLLVFESLFRERRPGTVVAASLLVCLSVLGGMPESMAFVLLLASAYYVFRTVTSALPMRAGAGYYFRHAFRLLTPIALGLLLSGPQLFPFLEYLGRSWTSHGGSTGASSNPLSGALSLMIPYFFGRIHQNWNGLSSHVLLPYLGGIPVLLGVTAVLAKKTPEARRIVLFFSGFGLFFLAKAYGLAVVNWIGRLPLLNKLIFAKYVVPEIAFCLAVLAAFGLDALQRSRISGKRFLAALGITLALPLIFLGLKPLELLPQLAQPQVRSYAASQAGITLAAVAVSFLLGMAALRMRRRRALLAAGLAAVVAAELFLYVPRGRAARRDPAAQPPFVEFLRADRSAFRVLPLNGALHPNTGSFFGLESVAVLDAMYPSRYMAFLRACISPDIVDRFTGSEIAGDVEPLLGHLRFLNVKYIVTPNELSGTIPDILRRGAAVPADRWGISATSYTIDGRTRQVLSQHPPSKIVYPVTPGGDGRLSFSIALSPGCWSPGKGDGVRFLVRVREGGILETVFDASIDPKNNPGHRRWFDATVDLGDFRGKRIEVVFETDPLKSADFDWAGWGDIRFGNRGPGGSLELVYDREVRIYRIEEPLPRARVVSKAVPVPDGSQALGLLKAGRLDHGRFAVLEAEPGEVAGTGRSGAQPPGEGRAEILLSRSNEVLIEADSPEGGFLVLSDMYDTGWRAYVDGRKRPVLMADYLFRGIALEPGKHRVRFEYAPRSFAWGWRASLIALAVLAGVVLRPSRLFHFPRTRKRP